MVSIPENWIILNTEILWNCSSMVGLQLEFGITMVKITISSALIGNQYEIKSLEDENHMGLNQTIFPLIL